MGGEYFRGLLGTGLTQGRDSQMGLAPYGLLHSGLGAKGLGYFGAVLNKMGGISTEISSEFPYAGKSVEHPLMVPTLTAQELAHLLSGSQPTDAIFDKAEAFARQRLEQGKSPFADRMGLRYPMPK